MNNILKTILTRTKQFTIVKENTNPFPESPEEENGVEEMDDMNAIDPTETPEIDEQPDEISDEKIIMYASLLLKAYQTPPSNNIPEELLTVTASNAHTVINFIEEITTLDKPTNKIEDEISKI